MLSAPWRDSSVALRQLDLIRLARANSAPPVAARFQGMLQTTWVSFGVFARTWFGEDPRNLNAIEAAATFRELFRDLRK